MSGKTNSQQAKQTLKEHIQALRVIASQQGKAFDQAESEQQQVLQVLSWATRQNSADISHHMQVIGDCISPVHRRFFESNNIRFEASSGKVTPSKQTLYRGSKITHADSGENAESDKTFAPEPPKGKKRIVYRGKEKWV